MKTSAVESGKLVPPHGSPNPKGRFDVWDFTVELETARNEEEKPMKKLKKTEKGQREKDAEIFPMNEAYEAFV